MKRLQLLKEYLKNHGLVMDLKLKNLKTRGANT